MSSQGPFQPTGQAAHSDFKGAFGAAATASARAGARGCRGHQQPSCSRYRSCWAHSHPQHPNQRCSATGLPAPSTCKPGRWGEQRADLLHLWKAGSCIPVSQSLTAERASLVQKQAQYLSHHFSCTIFLPVLQHQAAPRPSCEDAGTALPPRRAAGVVPAQSC